MYHTPVLLNPSIDALNIRPGGIYVDVTFGGGGHSREILRRFADDPTAHLYAFDQDPDAEQEAQKINNPRFTFIRSNFRWLSNFMRYHDVPQIDGLLADLGVSSHHFDEASRGFTFRDPEAPLDMRMNPREGLTAADILRDYTEERLATLFHLYGELRDSRRLAAAIVRARVERPLQTAADLLEVVQPILAHDKAKNPQARLFQALRIEVNHEMDALRDLLLAATDLIVPDGRLVVLTYHSLEDRLVKNLVRTGNVEGTLQQDPIYGTLSSPWRAVGQPIVPSEAEQQSNPRSRSAHLRIAQKQKN